MASWRIDDLDQDAGLASELFNLSGLGNEIPDGAYNMSDVLNLPIFQDQLSSVFPDMETLDLTAPSQNSVSSSQPSAMKQEEVLACGTVPNHSPRGNAVVCSKCSFHHALKAPTSPSKKLCEDTLTYLNQGQSYLVNLHYQSSDVSKYEGQLLKSLVKLCFYERKLQVHETEKYEEWKHNRPADRILEIDVPMSSGIHNIRSKGNLQNAYEFEWDPKMEAKLYIIVNCISSEFTKGKGGGESGVPFMLQIDTREPNALPDSTPCHSSGCQVKVFRSKGADRKHKAELQKLEGKTQDEIGQLMPSSEITEFKELPIEKVEEVQDSRWMSPRTPGAPSPSPRLTAASPVSALNSPGTSHQMLAVGEVSSGSTVEETRAWLQRNRFQPYLNMFASYTGADFLRLTRQDMIQLLGPADGIRLHNTLQSRATRPLLTLYVCLESSQQNVGMKEYLAMFLETLDLNELRKKLSAKCNLTPEQVVAIYRLGPTGIYVLVDDEMVRNFMDEGHFIVQLVREEESRYRIVLK